MNKGDFVSTFNPKSPFHEKNGSDNFERKLELSWLEEILEINIYLINDK